MTCLFIVLRNHSEKGGFMKRGTGILLHISSLPNHYGIGTFGNSAYEFVDFLRDTHQGYWQILPLGPTTYGDSPYQSPSSFAINPYLIDLDLLKENGLLSLEEYHHLDFGDEKNQVDFIKVRAAKDYLFQLAFQRKSLLPQWELSHFQESHQGWLSDYAFYNAYQNHVHNGNWMEWDSLIRTRNADAMLAFEENHKEELEFQVFLQFIAYKQWTLLKQYANANEIQIIGDIPIYAAANSTDTWSQAFSGIFQLSDSMQPKNVAGCPPDYFSVDGQYWGNTVYDWEKNKETGYQWWLERIHHGLSIYDWLRIDHFRGFESYWEIPYGSPSAAFGVWRKGPGMDFIDTIKNTLGKVQIIAEDLGLLTEEVHDFLKESGFPGMKVLSFAFDSDSTNPYLPHHYDKNCVVYTGTHDNDTILGWFDTANAQKQNFAVEYFRLTEEEGYHWGLIRGALSSTAFLAIIPMQDYLGLTSESRMNTPSTVGGNNWRWKLSDSHAYLALKERIASLVKLYSREAEKRDSL